MSEQDWVKFAGSEQTTTSKLVLSSKQMTEGSKAFYDGESLGSNPYTNGTASYVDWKKGWLQTETHEIFRHDSLGL